MMELHDPKYVKEILQNEIVTRVRLVLVTVVVVSQYTV